ncbi:MAG: putative nitrogen fixation protein NifT [Zetaproteobacteria bacterium CG06_land_8_20_14_3_00_59_53]|nr:MAG: putative nitrogen fixation protein NifT [Zetaproteobacteria bacterium CG2_30_59_37]PIO90556.1 MAG: putative nitrogen fixation protein NifT [Zetaproteobacteria bacterium CG23_combo_of_CG06-09_8_20_14_all_59_86]PIQ66025.1 MAG: putative nitrogen fixation protein NifT [Zetaproteobacteria bacterium CG11_big_fil_rev_8_21_14_0_20_59_439]PIU71505.1 MAG: putative nitrogen fixation protein NifT [Zetaproteobacteria bacterium CG06_land_8_20_14_3_00_59_53]PIU97763.1 MAG: putative nitrogen fixation p
MPMVMLRENAAGDMTLYVAKKDLEDVVTSIEFDQPDKWGGTITIGDGTSFYIDPLDCPPKLPVSLRARRG